MGQVDDDRVKFEISTVITRKVLCRSFFTLGIIITFTLPKAAFTPS